jgi:hypothetical protein
VDDILWTNEGRSCVLRGLIGKGGARRIHFSSITADSMSRGRSADTEPNATRR